MNKVKEYLTGKKFGSWTVIRFVFERTWECVCDCGSKKFVKDYTLTSGASKMCRHCAAKHNAFLRNKKHKNLDREYCIKKALYDSKIKSRSKKLGFKEFLSFEEYEKLIFEPCFYCGVVGGHKTKDYLSAFTGERLSDKVVTHNGLDRINNNLGYILDNVVPCCKSCNTAKMEKSKDEFIVHIVKIYKYLSHKKLITENT